MKKRKRRVRENPPSPFPTDKLFLEPHVGQENASHFIPYEFTKVRNLGKLIYGNIHHIEPGKRKRIFSIPFVNAEGVVTCFSIGNATLNIFQFVVMIARTIAHRLFRLIKPSFRKRMKHTVYSISLSQAVDFNGRFHSRLLATSGKPEVWSKIYHNHRNSIGRNQEVFFWRCREALTSITHGLSLIGDRPAKLMRKAVHPSYTTNERRNAIIFVENLHLQLWGCRILTVHRGPIYKPKLIGF